MHILRYPARRHIHASFIILVCCTVLVLSGCGNLVTGSIALPTRPMPSPIVVPTQSTDTNSSVPQAQLAKVQMIMDGMSLDQKLGQLMLVEFVGNNYQASGLQYMIARQMAGGFIYQESNHNFDAPNDVVSHVANFSQRAMADASIPLLIATDQEGGLVNRLRKFHGNLPSAADIAATGMPQVALAQGAQTAQWMLQLGITVDLAPVVDVQTVDPPVLVSRTFGRDPQTVAAYAGAFLNGLQVNGIAGCLKHFPGLGAINSDPHVGLPTVKRSLTDLENIDLAPYKLIIQRDHPAMIMATDVLMPAIDATLPAELSPKAINGVLRGQLGYNGVVITDGLYMIGISEKWALSQAAVLSIMAGGDIVEGPFTVAQVASVLTAFKQALRQGELTLDRINQSVERILLLKVQYGIIKLNQGRGKPYPYASIIK